MKTMKKLLLSICVLAASYAQSQSAFNLEVSSDVGTNIGFNVEYAESQENTEGYKISTVFRAYYISNKLESDYSFIKDINGSGIGAEIGFRNYFNKEAYKGFYAGSNFTAGTIKFEENNIYKENLFGEQVKFNGKYKYLSFFAPELGYKFLIANNFSLNIHAGTSWIIERKGEGDVDNKMFDNWVPRAGLSLGYIF